MLALDELIDSCEPTQVKHMMQVIEPQFQRDFISLLPKEVKIINYILHWVLFEYITQQLPPLNIVMLIIVFSIVSLTLLISGKEGCKLIHCHDLIM